MSQHLPLGVRLSGATATPRHDQPAARVTWWRDAVQRLDRGGATLVTIDDALGPDPEAPDAVRPDALLLASYLAPLTSRIALLPTVTTTHTEPFHVATALQTLDFASRGRAGWVVAVSPLDAHAAQFGRRTLPTDAAVRADDLWDEAGDVVETARALWDSWQDDAIIRDAASGRFLDRDRLHYVDVETSRFSVKGPSIVPRSPQGQPLVAVDVVDAHTRRIAAHHADLAFVDAALLDEVAGVRAEAAASDRDEALRVWVDLEVLIEADPQLARRAADRLGLAPAFVGTADGVRERLAELSAAGADGVRLVPARLPADLDAILSDVLPDTVGAPATARAALGLARPANRFEKVLA